MALSILDVRLHGESIGSITRLPDDSNLFTFTEEYINNPKRFSLSFSFIQPSGELKLPDARPVRGG